MKDSLDRPGRHGFFVFLPLSLVGSLFTAVVFVVGLTAGLPPTDWAYGTNPFHDPFGSLVLGPIVVVVSLVVWPFTYFALRETNLDRSLPFVYLVTMAWTGVVAYWAGPISIILTFVGFGVSLLFCWKSAWARRGASVDA